jgi:hypothetical protein
MVVFAVVEHGDSLLCVEIDDTSPNLLKTGRVVQTFPKNQGVVISGGENPPGRALVVVPPEPAKKPKRKFRLKSLQYFQKLNGKMSSHYDKHARDFHEWIKKNEKMGPQRAATLFYAYHADTHNKPGDTICHTGIVYGSLYAGWKLGLWELDDSPGHECMVITQ